MNYYNVSYHFYADDIQIYFKIDSKDLCVSKLNTVFNAAKTWIFNRELKLNKDKTNKNAVGNPLQLRNIDLPSNLKLDQTDINLSTKPRNLGDAAVKKKVIGGLINIAEKNRSLSTESLSQNLCMA